MKKELIKLSEESGFESQYIIPPKEMSELHYYLWMCELQKWIRDENGIYIGITYFKQGNGYWVSRIHYRDINIPEPIYEQALEAGLIEALKLLKE